MISPADANVLRLLFDERSYSRGLSYARSGRVLTRQWDGDRVTGQVQGTRAEPYDVSASVRRGPSGVIDAVTAACSCPVAVMCKHAAALLLAPSADPRRRTPSVPAQPAARPDPARLRVAAVSPRPKASGTAAGRPAPSQARTRGWEDTVAGLLDERSSRAHDEPSRVALQFELVTDPYDGEASIQLRPVALSATGNWVRTGISWSDLEYGYHARLATGSTITVVGLLRELLALFRIDSGRAHWGYSVPVVTLEAVGSRRVWDLLAEIRDSGGPLVMAGRTGGVVQLQPSAELFLDLTESKEGLSLQTVCQSDGSEIPPDSARLVGRPPHGVAWWDGRESGAGLNPTLHLAPLVGEVSDAEVGLSAEPIRVPRRDAARFLSDIAPRLRRRARLRSSDGTVDLDAIPEVSLALSVRHHDGNRVELEWARALPSGWRAPLTDEAVVDDATSAALGVASKLAHLVEARPDGARLVPRARLAGMDVVELVTDILPRLAEIDGLEIEQLGEPVQYRPATEAPRVTVGGQPSASGDWFDLLVEVTIDGETVAFQDLFTALAEGRSHLILPSGTFFPLDSAELSELAALIAEARTLQDRDGEQIRLSRFQASLWDELAQLGILSEQAERWDASVRALGAAAEMSAAGDVPDEPLPKGLRAELRPYQHTGYQWLSFIYRHRLGGILADDMGLGKTLQALALVARVREEGQVAAPFLVVAPTSVVPNWESECHRFTPGLKVVSIGETSRRRSAPLAEVIEGADLVVTSYAIFRLDYAEYESIGWAGLFLDEAQFAKNTASQAYRKARTLPTPFKLAITGTPLENNLMELWALLSIGAPGLFPRSDRFTEEYRIPIERNGDEERLVRLRQRIRPLMLRRSKEQVASELPDKQEQVLELDLEARHRRVYQTYLQRERQKVLGLLGDMQRNRIAIFRSLTILRQACLDASLVDPDATNVPSTKLDALMPMLEEAVADGHRVLVFSQFTRFLTLARRRLEAAGIEHCYLDGRTRRRAEVIADFREGRAPVFLISLKAGGFGLNLTEADHCILLDPWWNPAAEAQAVDRAHRIGQTRKVIVYRMVARDTIEEKVMALKARKAALFANVVDAGGFESAALSAEDVQALLS